MLADLNDDCTLALLKWLSSAQLFAFISSPEFSNRRLRDCAMVALKDVYAPFSLKSSINAEGTYAVYVADAKNGNMAVLKHPDLFHRSPLSDFLDKADIRLTAGFVPANLQIWLDVARSISVSQLQLSFATVRWNPSPRDTSAVTQLVQAFSAVRSFCVFIDSSIDRGFRCGEDFYHPELEDAMEAVEVSCLSLDQLRSLKLVSQPAQFVPAAFCWYGGLALQLSHQLPRSPSLESIDLRGVFIKRCRRWESPSVCDRLLCRMLANLKANRALKCLQLRCHIESISELQGKLPDGCKIVELNGEPVLNEELLKRMHCSPNKVMIIQEKQGVNDVGQVEKLYLHIDCAPPLPIP